MRRLRGPLGPSDDMGPRAPQRCRAGRPRADPSSRSSFVKNRHRQHSRPRRRGRRNGRAGPQCPRQPDLADRDDPDRARRRRGAVRDHFPSGGPLLAVGSEARLRQDDLRSPAPAIPRGRSMSPTGATVDGIEIRMPKSGAIAGRVVDDLGDPVPDVTVTAESIGRIRITRRTGGSRLRPGRLKPMILAIPDWRTDRRCLRREREQCCHVERCSGPCHVERCSGLVDCDRRTDAAGAEAFIRRVATGSAHAPYYPGVTALTDALRDFSVPRRRTVCRRLHHASLATAERVGPHERRRARVDLGRCRCHPRADPPRGWPPARPGADPHRRRQELLGARDRLGGRRLL